MESESSAMVFKRNPCVGQSEIETEEKEKMK